MKRLLLIVYLLVFGYCAGGQTPQSISYQAVARDSSGHILSVTPVSVRISIREYTITGPVRYSETHNITTSPGGMFSLFIGNGIPNSGSFSGVKWSNGAFFLQTAIAIGVDTSYTDLGTEQLMSVPYALYAASIKLKVSNTGDTLYAGNGSFVIVPGISAANCYCLTDTLPTRDNNMALGNPTSATATPSDSANYLITRHQFALSYNNQKGIANWVSWHLSAAWKGTTPRCNCFTQDAMLPAGYYRATTSNYTGTGFDRGHLCPSDDRDGSDTDNAATFKMTNIAPQSPILNQQTWEDLEAYCRTLITQGKELYIVAGSYGAGGTGSLGGVTMSIAGSRITVPGYFWKVIVVLPQGTNDLCRVNTTTRVIAVAMPNVQTVNANPWSYYRTTVDAIETTTGLNLLSLVPATTQAAIESAVDTGPTY
jgi:endonuclease G